MMNEQNQPVKHSLDEVAKDMEGKKVLEDDQGCVISKILKNPPDYLSPDDVQLLQQLQESLLKQAKRTQALKDKMSKKSTIEQYIAQLEARQSQPSRPCDTGKTSSGTLTGDADVSAVSNGSKSVASADSAKMQPTATPSGDKQDEKQATDTKQPVPAEKQADLMDLSKLSPEKVVKTYVEAWNEKAFGREYECFSQEFLRIEKQVYLHYRMSTYQEETKSGEVRQMVMGFPRSKISGDKAEVVCERATVKGNKPQKSTEEYTLKRQDDGWKIVNVRSLEG